MAAHIGIVACSSEGAALCYRTVCLEGASRPLALDHPEVSMHTGSYAHYDACMRRGDWEGVAALMLASAAKLARAGADFVVCPDNTIHRALPFVEARSPLPWIHIAEVVAAEAAGRGFRRVGIVGTRWLVESEVYPDKLAARGIAHARPEPAERDEIHRIIVEELVVGVHRPEAVRYFQGVFERMKAEGCDAVVLGCTEIPLVMSDRNSPLPTLDSTRLLARAALARARAPRAAPSGVVLKRFESPDETRVFEKGRFEIVRVGGMTIGRATYEPGWRWSLHVGKAKGEAMCEVEHVGVVVSGRATAAMRDGGVVEMRAGDVFYVAPGHDSWVVGDEPYVSLHLLGADHYA